MPKSLSHEDIAQRFLEAKAVDFGALGRLIAELGPELAVNDQGWHGVNLGKFHILACIMPAEDIAGLVGNLQAAALTATALQGAAKASMPK